MKHMQDEFRIDETNALLSQVAGLGFDAPESSASAQARADMKVDIASMFIEETNAELHKITGGMLGEEIEKKPEAKEEMSEAGGGLKEKLLKAYPRLKKIAETDDMLEEAQAATSFKVGNLADMIWIDTPGHSWVVSEDGEILGEEDGGIENAKLAKQIADTILFNGNFAKKDF